jgi:hypothetical protein
MNLYTRTFFKPISPLLKDIRNFAINVPKLIDEKKAIFPPLNILEN